MGEVESTVTPSPDDVGSLIGRLVRSAWPTSDLEQIAWFKEFDLLDPDQIESSHELAQEQSFDGPSAPNWPRSRFGWHTFQDELVGVRWFLWEELSREEAHLRAVALKRGLTQRFGAPVEETGKSDSISLGFTCFWEADDRTIDMYFHSGVYRRPDGSTVDDLANPALVQIHVDHTERASAKDEDAVARQQADKGPPPHPT